MNITAGQSKFMRKLIDDERTGVNAMKRAQSYLNQHARALQKMGLVTFTLMGRGGHWWLTSEGRDLMRGQS